MVHMYILSIQKKIERKIKMEDNVIIEDFISSCYRGNNNVELYIEVT